MKNLFLTTFIGDCRKDSLKIFEKYCEKYNLDLEIITDYKINYYDLGFEKFRAIEMLEKYDRIVYVDGDVLITPQAPNIFEAYPDPSFFYAFHESGYGPENDRDALINLCMTELDKYFFFWPKEWNGKRRYFNSGVLLFSKEHAEALSKFSYYAPRLRDFWGTDQTTLNCIVTFENVKYKNLSWDWNRGDLSAPDWNLMRYQSNFIHYSGRGYDFVHGIGKYNMLLNDMKFLYPEINI
jgi:lipopolysaccharide biosynthesis glycosyltransferase